MQSVCDQPAAAILPRNARQDWVAEWKSRFEQSAAAPTWLAAHKWNVDLRTMQAVALEVRQQLHLQPTDGVLEVGCGTGAFLSLVLHPDQKGVGFDLCEALLRRGASGEVDARRIVCGAADAAHLPVADNTFDKVLCYAVFQCLPDEESARQVVRELVRVCKSGGIVLIGDVSGRLEKHRQKLVRLGLREGSIDVLLSAASPLWRLRRRWQHEIPPHLFVRRSLIKEAVEGLPCEVRFRTAGTRPHSRSRFDVVIHKVQSQVSRHGQIVLLPSEQRVRQTPVTLQRFESFESLRPLRDEWNALALEIGGDLFSSFDWCATWWKHFHEGRTPQFFVARCGDQAVGFVPLFQERVGYGPWRIRVVRMVGSCDAGTRCDLAIRPEFIEPVLCGVARNLDAAGPWDLVHIGDLSGDYPHGRAIARAFAQGFEDARVVFRTGYFPNAVFDVPESYEAYLAQLSPNERSSIRRTERRLYEQHHAVMTTTPPEQVGAAFKAFQRQHEAFWARSGRLGYFWDWPGSLQFHRELCETQAQNGRLYLLRLDADGQSIGYHYSQQFGRHIHWFSGSRTPEARWEALSPGRQLHCALVREAIHKGVRRIDGMNGYFEFKKRWGARFTQLQNITAVSRNMISRIAVRDVTTATRMHYLHNRVWFWHLAPWLRTKFPGLRASLLHRGQTRRFIRNRFMEYALAAQADDAVCYSAAPQMELGS